MTYDWMTSSCAGRSFGLHGAGKRGAAVVPVYGVRVFCMMLAPPGWPAPRDGAEVPVVVDRSAGAGGSGCVLCCQLHEKGKNSDLSYCFWVVSS
jgi:hypothetical protein